jgi:hypothetical protein
MQSRGGVTTNTRTVTSQIHDNMQLRGGVTTNTRTVTSEIKSTALPLHRPAPLRLLRGIT